jgi:sialate O-acetylesterase
MILQRLFFISCLLSSFSGSMTAKAELRLPALFGDHMVLQAGMPIPIWGRADPGEKIGITFKGKAYTAIAGADGTWSLKLRACRPGGPYELVVQGSSDRLLLRDVLVGDVWLASGQSNMEFGIQTDSRAAQSIAQATDSLIRFFYVPMARSLQPQADIGHPVSGLDGRWVVCSSALLASKWAWHGFSAISYYFARRMRAVSRGPIGVIGSYKGGTPAQAWMSLAALEADPAFHRHVLARQKVVAMVDSAAHAPAAARPVDIGFGTPAGLFNAMIAPLIPYAIKGVIWYQGESNGDRLADALEYKTLFPALIRDWRNKWEEGNLPFLYVQLPNFRVPARTPSEGNWPWVREAQLLAGSLPGTGMAVTIDLGTEKNIHPWDKLDVGDRLALVASHVVYGGKSGYTGPVYDHMSVNGSAIRLVFTQTGGGLTAAHWDSVGEIPHMVPDTVTELKGFAIAGEDMHFEWARAVLHGNSVIVSSDKVSRPVAVRYDWADNPEGNLYNTEGLPASPFRTDAGIP